MAGLRYKDAGVDIDAGARLVDRLKAREQAFKGANVLSGIGGFASLVSLPTDVKNPVLVSGTDGVGTKLKVAARANRHDTVGIDLVAMCINDIITTGARPLFFLDYFATSALDVEQADAVIAGIMEGCDRAECTLVGGETAELPGFFHGGEYDIAGFALGVVDREKIVDGSGCRPGNAVIGIASSGLHSNGYSLANRALFDLKDLPLDTPVEKRPLIDVLLEPTTIYAKATKGLVDKGLVHAMAHITGGGIVENLPRVLQPNHAAAIRRDAWTPPAIFQVIASAGGVEADEMWRVFNMGIGFAVICENDNVETVLAHLSDCGHAAWQIGDVQERDGEALVWK